MFSLQSDALIEHWRVHHKQICLFFVQQLDMDEVWENCRNSWHLSADDILAMRTIYNGVKGREVLGLTAQEMQVRKSGLMAG